MPGSLMRFQMKNTHDLILKSVNNFFPGVGTEFLMFSSMVPDHVFRD